MLSPLLAVWILFATDTGKVLEFANTQYTLGANQSQTNLVSLPANYGAPVAATVVEDEVVADAVVEEAAPAAVAPAPADVHSSAELLEAMTGTASDAPLCMTCGVKMRPAGSCYVCEGCGSTSGCS